MTDIKAQLKTAIDVHGQLSQLIAPATPDTIRASEIKANPAILIIIACAIVSFSLLVLSFACPQDSTLTMIIGITGASGLGSSFYALNAASEYLKNRTFDPLYNQAYLVRLCIGLCAGLILALFAKDFGIDVGIEQNGLALVGGYSAEAVIQILQRVAETLVAAVRGSGKEQAKAKAEKEFAKKKVNIGSALQEALLLDDDKSKEKIKKVIKDINK